MPRKRQIIKFTTDGTHKRSKLTIDDKEIYYESLNISGDKNVGYDIVIGLSQSKVTDEQVKQAAQLTPTIGGFIQDESEEDEDEYYDRK